MRIADKMAFNQVNKNLIKNRSDMAELQNQAATQKKINKPSDDPLAATRVLGARTEEKTNGQFLKNINNAKTYLEVTDQALGELTEALVRAKELAISQSNDASGNAETRRLTAAEVDQILNQAIQIGNRKLGERFIFGGLRTQVQPFDNEGKYFGDEGDLKIQTNKDSYVAMNIPGNQIFLGVGIEADGVVRASSSTPRTVDELKEFKKDTQALEEKRASEAENSLQLRGPASVTSSKTEVLKGPQLESQGTHIFAALQSLNASLMANDKAGIQESMDLVDSAISQVILARSQVGARIMAISGGADTLQKTIVDNRMTASQNEDADVFQVISDINKTDATLKATLETSGKMIQPSLLDFLR